MRRFAAFTMLVGGLWCLSATADEPNDLNCIGITADHTVLSVAVTQIDETSSAKIQYGKTSAAKIEGLRSSVTYHVHGVSTLHWDAEQVKDVIAVQHIHARNYALHFNFPARPLGTLKAEEVKGDTVEAYCTVTGTWADQLEETVPDHAQQLIALLQNQPSDDTLIRAITLAHNADYPPIEKRRFYEAVFSRDELRELVKSFAVAAVFSDSVEATYQLSILERFQNDPKIVVRAAQALADCARCSIGEGVYAKLVSLFRSQIHFHPNDLWSALADISFQKRNEALPARTSALDLIFSNEALPSQAADEKLGTLSELLMLNIASDKVSDDAGDLMTRILTHPHFGKMAASRTVHAAIRNHANQTLAQPSLPPSLLLNVLRTIKAKNLITAPLQDEDSWLNGESLVLSTKPSNMLKLVEENMMDHSVIENVLQWMADQSEPVPNGDEIISAILTHLNASNSFYWQFNFENQKRGLLPDLGDYAFSPQARVLHNGVQVLTALLTQTPLSNDLLQKLGQRIIDSTDFSLAESERLLTLVANHPNYREMRTTQTPHGLVTGCLERAIKSEKLGSKVNSKWTVSFLNGLLRNLSTARHVDPDDADLKSYIGKLIEQTKSI